MFLNLQLCAGLILVVLFVSRLRIFLALFTYISLDYYVYVLQYCVHVC